MVMNDQGKTRVQVPGYAMGRDKRGGGLEQLAPVGRGPRRIASPLYVTHFPGIDVFNPIDWASIPFLALEMRCPVPAQPAPGRWRQPEI